MLCIADQLQSRCHSKSFDILAAMLTISNSRLEQTLDLPSVVEALAQSFEGQITTPQRQHYDIDVNDQRITFLTMPAWQKDFLGIKLITVNPENPVIDIPSIQGNYMLYELPTGTPLALFDAKLLTNIRTAAASALASRFLSRPDSEVLLMVGTGSLAPYLIRAHACVRSFRKVIIWGRNPHKATNLAEKLVDLFDDLEVATDLNAAVGQADVLSVATMSQLPLILGSHIRSGQHIDLVGSFKPDMREADDECIRRCDVYIDTAHGINETGDLSEPIRKGILRRSMIRGDLFQLCRGERPGRTADEQITLFKSVGHALEDLSAAVLAYKRLTVI